MNCSASLYIHIPFCNSLCDYCDFFSEKKSKYSENYIDSYLYTIINDIKNQIKFFGINEIPTVYIGGGTPSVLGKKIKILFDFLKTIPDFSPVEFTIEANPESADEEFLEICRKGGINRISLGMQTFFQPSRKAVNRIGDIDLLHERLTLACNYFPDTVSVDLITGLPYQNEKIILDDINHLLSFPVKHISLYSLSVEDNTPLKNKVINKTVILPEKEYADSLWLIGAEAIKKSGFDHYEISNFALNGKRCLHNLRYWQMLNWFACGPSASGTIINEKTCSAKRYTYVDDIDSYIKKPFISNAECEELNKNVFLKDCLLMGFRCKDGLDSKIFYKRFGITVEECIPVTLELWKNKDKMLFLNQFLSDIFSELDHKSLF